MTATTGRKRGRPALTPEQRESRRLERNRKARETRRLAREARERLAKERNDLQEVRQPDQSQTNETTLIETPQVDNSNESSDVADDGQGMINSAVTEFSEGLPTDTILQEQPPATLADGENVTPAPQGEEHRKKITGRLLLVMIDAFFPSIMLFVAKLFMPDKYGNVEVRQVKLTRQDKAELEEVADDVAHLIELNPIFLFTLAICSTYMNNLISAK